MKEKKKRFKHEHGSSFSVDYYAYASRMRSWNAGFKVLFSIISLLLCIACNNLFVSLAVIFFMGFLTVAVGGLKLHHYISMLLVPIIFLIFGTIAIAIGFSMHPVGQYHVHFLNLFYIYCSKASLLKAGNLVLRRCQCTLYDDIDDTVKRNYCCFEEGPCSKADYRAYEYDLPIYFHYDRYAQPYEEFSGIPAWLLWF